jgi:hypothetical protein
MNTTLKPIAHSDVLRFMHAKGTAKPCRECGHMRFNFHDEVSAKSRFVVTAPKFPGADLGRPNAIEAMDLLTITCANCAPIRILQRQPVAEWIEANPTQ